MDLVILLFCYGGSCKFTYVTLVLSLLLCSVGHLVYQRRTCLVHGSPPLLYYGVVL